MEASIKSVKKYGGIVEAALSYTTSPVHSEEYFVEKAVAAVAKGLGHPLKERLIAWNYMELLERDMSQIKLFGLKTGDVVEGVIRPPREGDYRPLWQVEIQTMNAHRKTASYRADYNKFPGCPMKAIALMMAVYAAVRRVLKEARMDMRARKEKKHEANV